MSCIVAFTPLSARPTSSVWLVQPENIFVKNGVFKIGDMGLVTVIKGSPHEVCRRVRSRNRRQLMPYRIQTVQTLSIAWLHAWWWAWQIDEGDCRYLPREVLQNDDELDLRKADVFSLGCSMYAVITSEELPRNGALWHEIRNGKLRYLPQGQKLVSAKLAAVWSSQSYLLAPWLPCITFARGQNTDNQEHDGAQSCWPPDYRPVTG